MPRIGKKTIERLETSLEDELHRRADAGALTAEDLQGLDAGLFAPAVYDESAAERGGYSNYSYWGSTLRIFWRNRVARCLVILLIALLAVVSIVTLALFDARACRVGRSAFYTIAACAAGSLMVVQTALNIFGAMDLLPLTGVTLPFVSNGGSAMLASWGLLAFLKASDTREKSSFAIRSPAGKEVPVP